MTLSAIHSVSVANNLPPVQKAAPSPVTSAPVSPVEDKVTISSAARGAAASVDVDHDGDSH